MDGMQEQDMPTFVYEAMNKSGEAQKGQVIANTSEEAITQIRGLGYFPTSVREQKTKKTGAASGNGADTATGAAPARRKLSEITISFGGVNQKTLTLFTRQLSTLQDAGLPILRSLSVLEQQQKPGTFKTILKNLHEEVSGGSTLSDAMAKSPKAFDRLYTRMIAAGELGGVLDVILQRLADFQEKAAKLRRRIIGAMIYPVLVLSVAAIIVLGIMVFIVPKFEGIFKDFDTELPTMTLVLINSSRWLCGTLDPNQWLPGIVYTAFIPFAAFFGFKLLRKTSFGKSFTDYLLLLIPVVGQLAAKNTIARFTRTLGTLINAGVPILDAILITRDTTGNVIFQNALTDVHDSVRQGDSFADPLRKAKVCDAIVVNMINVGEETGELDNMLLKIADNYDDEVDTLVASLVSLLEPVMVVLLGVCVGFIVVALFLPLIKLIQSVS
jgi:type IV pilus assembly protein PilC